jgi:AbiV family abortive infection protein
MAGKKPLPQYDGPLSPNQAAQGIAAAIANARLLVEDAEALLERRRWPRAAALAILAIEEAGKPPIIRSILLARDEKERREEWKAYRSHTKKNLASILPELVSQGARSLDDLAPIFDSERDHGQVLDTLKQIAFYSEAAGNCNWSRPDTVINESLARSIVSVARLLSGADDTAMSSEAELELWVKHLKPVWKSAPAFEVKQALAACYAEAEAAGVLQGRSTASKMTRFLFGI